MGFLGFINSIGSGKSHEKAAQRSQVRQNSAQADTSRLHKHVHALTSTKKPRNYSNPDTLNEVALYLQSSFKELGVETSLQSFQAAGRTYQNVIATLGPAKSPRIVIGAHYDVAGDQPGADDNASGVAGLLELARLLKDRAPQLKHRIDLVAYCLEEPPFFGSHEMGSAVHASSLKKAGVEVKLMMSLEMIGYFSEEEGSQNFPVAALKYIYPTKGNFIAVVGEPLAVPLVLKIKNLMSENSRINVQFINAPRSLPGVDLSDHRNYWDQGYPAVMLTDTAFFRNPNYHTAQDRIETLNFQKMAEVVEGVYGVVLGF